MASINSPHLFSTYFGARMISIRVMAAGTGWLYLLRHSFDKASIDYHAPPVTTASTWAVTLQTFPTPSQPYTLCRGKVVNLTAVVRSRRDPLDSVGPTRGLARAPGSQAVQTRDYRPYGLYNLWCKRDRFARLTPDRSARRCPFLCLRSQVSGRRPDRTGWFVEHSAGKQRTYWSRLISQRRAKASQVERIDMCVVAATRSVR